MLTSEQHSAVMLIVLAASSLPGGLFLYVDTRGTPEGHPAVMSTPEGHQRDTQQSC